MMDFTKYNKQVTINLSNPKETLTALEVQGVMDTVIAKNIFSSSGGDLVSKVSASYGELSITAIPMLRDY